MSQLSFDKKIESAMASVEFEGFFLTDKQKQWINKLAKDVEDGKINWDEAIQMTLDRHKLKGE